MATGYRRGVCLPPRACRHLLRTERKDVDGAEKAYRAANKAAPENGWAHFKLGHLLLTERNDVDGAEKAFRAAIKAVAIPGSVNS